MANFLKPTWIDPKGYDPSLNKQSLGIAHYATVGLWGGGPGGEPLKVTPNDPSVATLVEQSAHGDIRVFRVTGLKAGYTMLEAKTSAGAVWAFMQIEVGGGAAAGPSRGKRIVVDLDSQTVDAHDDGARVYHFDCVTGDQSHPTTPGIFSVIRKAHPYRSRRYDVQMNYAMFFTADGKALHQYHGSVPLSVVRALKSGVTDYLGSHGCVRLTEQDARVLYEWTPLGTPVQVR
jgi:hypothetical protein